MHRWSGNGPKPLFRACSISTPQPTVCCYHSRIVVRAHSCLEIRWNFSVNLCGVSTQVVIIFHFKSEKKWSIWIEIPTAGALPFSPRFLPIYVLFFGSSSVSYFNLSFSILQFLMFIVKKQTKEIEEFKNTMINIFNFHFWDTKISGPGIWMPPRALDIRGLGLITKMKSYQYFSECSLNNNIYHYNNMHIRPYLLIKFMNCTSLLICYMKMNMKIRKTNLWSWTHQKITLPSLPKILPLCNGRFP